MSEAHDRKAAEQRFHDDRYAEENRLGLYKYYSVIGPTLGEFRRLAGAAAANSDVLEYGCGAEPHALGMAHEAKSVRGIDISPVGIEHARELADAQGLGHFEFLTMDAETLEFPDDSFDLVYGAGILHHLELSRALPEVVRVLRPSGRAIFVEPLGHNPAINLYRRLTPAMRTPDEHPLRLADLRLASSFFEASEYRFQLFLSLAAVPFRKTRLFGRVLSGLGAADRVLFRTLPPARRLAWYVVMALDGPRKPAETRAKPS